jgi:hypothetical protein
MTHTCERRRHIRRQASLSARVVFNPRSPSLSCTVQNLCSSGAQIAFAGPVDLPGEFALEVPGLDLNVQARVAWSRAEEHGITFVWPHKTAWA